MVPKHLLIGATAIMLAACGAAGKVHDVHLEHGMVSTQHIAAKVGDKLVVYHRDEIGEHALYSTDSVHEFDLSDMKHGDHYDIELKQAGTFLIQCRHMDHMKIEVVVTE